MSSSILQRDLANLKLSDMDNNQALEVRQIAQEAIRNSIGIGGDDDGVLVVLVVSVDDDGGIGGDDGERNNDIFNHSPIGVFPNRLTHARCLLWSSDT